VKRIAASAGISVVFLLGFLIAIVACSRESKESATSTQTGTSTTAPKEQTPVYCTDTAVTVPCSTMPHNVATNAGYNTVNMDAETQADFDNFSWQSFVALNWPSNPDGTPSTAPLGSPGPTVWDLYKRADDVFLPGGATPDSNYPTQLFPPPPPACTASNTLTNGVRPHVVQMFSKDDDELNITDAFNEAAVNVPLIDSNGNFVAYDVAMNKDEFTYIFTKKYYNSNNQPPPTTTDPAYMVDFPPGVTGAAEGSIELKSAWKVLTAADDASTYITRTMQLYVPEQNFCTPPLQMGLIGMHIIHKTEKENAWIWSTFEHVNNAPLSSTPLPAEAKKPAGQCAPPASAPKMSLYNPACTLPDGKPCPLNVPPVQPGTKDIHWATSQPYAKDYLTNGQYGTQVVRCSDIYKVDGGTASLNPQWQQKVPKPYSSYMLIGSQWFAPSDFPPGTSTDTASVEYVNPDFPPGSIAAPPMLQNVSAETYLQNGTVLPGFSVGSCLGCHSGANGAQCEPADFSFMLGRAKPVQPCQKEGHAATMQRMAALKP